MNWPTRFETGLPKNAEKEANSMSLKVLIVDDDAVYRKVLRRAIGAVRGAEAAGEAGSGTEAIAEFKRGNYDLVLLDIHMPGMNGVETLKHLKTIDSQIPIVMISGVSSEGASTTMSALNSGALEFIPKPTGTNAGESLAVLRRDIANVVQIVRSRTGTNVRQMATAGAGSHSATPGLTPRKIAAVPPAGISFGAIGIGISTGGPKALTEFVPKIPADFPVPIFIVQHMPKSFTAALARDLDARSLLTVKEAASGDAARPGTIYIAPGGQHMAVAAIGSKRVINLNEDPPENNCRPAVDVLFRSMAIAYGHQGVLSVVMTGMGKDGTKGVEALKKRKCYSLTQSESSCAVYGMPQAVDEAGLSDESISHTILVDRLLQLVRKS